MARFQRQIEVVGECWLWTGDLTRDGYARWRPGPGQDRQMVHRLTHEWYVGPIPEGMTVDHLCHTEAVERGECGGGICDHRRCVNPAHGEVVTMSTNTVRQDHANRRKTTCAKGHPFTEENTRIRRGRRECLTCERARG